MDSKTDVYLTIDFECRRDCSNYEKPLYGKTSGGKFYGLDFILETLEKFNLYAVFFVEPFFTYKFGESVLIDVCSKILSKGHDIQLHIHPYFKSNGDKLFEDRLYTYSYEEQVSLIQEGKEILLKCGVPEIIAFRAGSFAINNITYKALDACGIKISSNYNLDFLGKTCKISIPDKHNDFFYYDQILEVPITSFYEYNIFALKKKFKHMQITAVSFPEMKHVLINAGKSNLKNICILFHSHEFVSKGDKTGNPNNINIRRFLKLCEFLSNNKSKFNVKTISQIDLSRLKIGSKKANIPEMPVALTLMGKIEQLRKKIRNR